MSRAQLRDARERSAATAVWAIIRRDGFDAASVRAVAEEAGMSAGSLRHLFASQDDVHVFAMEELMRLVSARVVAALPPLGAEPPALTRPQVSAALREVLPLTDETTDLYLAHLQFVTRATVNPALAPVARRTFDELQHLYVLLLAGLVASAEAPPDLAVVRRADELAVLMDGIVLRRLVAPHLLTEGEAVRQVEAFLDATTAGGTR